MKLNKAVHLKITGQVQGVFYRHSAQAEAKRLGIVGLARNETDGSVIIEAEGSEIALKQFIDWCHTGPSSATVRSVKSIEAIPHGYSDFTII